MTGTVGVMTQTNRAEQCSAYMRHRALDGDSVVLVSDPSAFAIYELPESTEVRVAKPEVGVLPSGKLLSSKVNRRVVNWARSGSQFGVRFEKWARAMQWRLRYLDRFVLLLRSRRKRKVGSFGNLDESPIVRHLRAVHSESPIQQVVVFDLFDLPAAMHFSQQSDVDVLVR